MNDAELVDGLLRGDIEAQVGLLAYYQENLTTSLVRRFLILSEGEIEEIVADSLYQMIRDPGLIDLSRGKISSLLYTIASRKAIDSVRRQKVRRREVKLVGLDDLNSQLTADEATVERWQDDRFHNQEGQEEGATYPFEVVVAARQVIEDLKLTGDDLDHIHRRLVEKLPPKEIAALMGISLGNENVRWYRLMKRTKTISMKQPVLVEYFSQQGLEVPKV